MGMGGLCGKWGHGWGSEGHVRRAGAMGRGRGCEGMVMADGVGTGL